MVIAVTGASGFVGAALCEALVVRGEHVVGIDRPGAPAGHHSGPGRFTFCPLDVREPGGLDPILARHGVDRLVIGAAITADEARERRDPASIIAVNVAAVADAIRAAAEAGVERMVFLGSGAVYGDSAYEAEPLVEDVTPSRPRSLYAISKQAAEATVLRLADTFGADIVAARLGTCFGPYERATGLRDTLSAPLQVLQRAQAGEPIRLPRPHTRDWLYVRDAVAGILALLDAPALPHRVYNVAAGFRWSVAAWCACLAERMPGVDWSLSGPEDGTIALYDAADRAPMGIARILADTDYRPRYDMAAAADDFLAFLAAEHPRES
ncbi:NAD-dependent epimerase/dehydratase family protein [uncultured Enterovirga sp.]|uniref:NAD-dependent epimerase/dehydratase family protein n=1 Tax=uncultured Enterovirga sp. TaxID=2026352 RepID=UPI0035C99F11